MVYVLYLFTLDHLTPNYRQQKPESLKYSEYTLDFFKDKFTRHCRDGTYGRFTLQKPDSTLNIHFETVGIYHQK